MKAKLRTLLIAGGVLAAAAGGGAAIAGATGGSGDDGPDAALTGNTLDRASSAALKAVGSGKVTETSADDEHGSGYEVEVTKADGSQVDVHLDKGFGVVRSEADTPDAGGDGSESDRAITGSALQRASEAALKATGGGKVTETEQGDEDSYYEVEVTKADGSQVDVQLDRSFNVVSRETDHENGD